jgi:hypothetical protein
VLVAAVALVAVLRQVVVVRAEPAVQQVLLARRILVAAVAVAMNDSIARAGQEVLVS